MGCAARDYPQSVTRNVSERELGEIVRGATERECLGLLTNLVMDFPFFSGGWPRSAGRPCLAAQRNHGQKTSGGYLVD